jgi:large subunit ribosomal protein L4
MNKREKQIAIKSALTSKVQDEKFVVVDQFNLDEVKTSKFVQILKNLKASKALVITKEKDDKVVLSARNIPDVKTTISSTINVYDILKYDTIVIAKDAVAAIEEVYA